MLISVLLSILAVGQCLYIPEVLLASSTGFLNHQLSVYGDNITDQIDKASIPNIQYNDTFNGVKIFFNLTNITQQSHIDWVGNILKVTDAHNLSIFSKNINITLKAHIQFKVSLIKQKGTLDINIVGLETDTDLAITQPPCSDGVGFDLQIRKVLVHTDKLVIKIQGKGVDNIIINAVMSVLTSRLPNIINNIALNTINPFISTYTCQGVQQLLAVGQSEYIGIVNTTQLPHFNITDQTLYSSIDLTLINVQSNKTNTQVQNDNLPENTQFLHQSNVSVIASSNMLNLILWAIDDSKILHINVTNQLLNTQTLAILLPSLKKLWPSRPIILFIEPSNTLSHLYFRNGKILTSLSISAMFAVNVTGLANQTPEQCLAGKRCINAINLNITALLSVGAKIEKGSILKGLVDSVSVEEITVISKQEQVNVDTMSLQQTFSILISSYRPQINKILQAGQPLDLSLLKKYKVDGILMNAHKNYAQIGVIVDS